MNRQIYAKILQKPINVKKLLICVILSCIVLGAIYIFGTWKIYVQNSEDKVKALAEAAAAFVSTEPLNHLQPQAQYSETHVYQQLKNSLIQFKQQNNEVNNVYLYTHGRRDL